METIISNFSDITATEKLFASSKNIFFKESFIPAGENLFSV